MLNVEYIQTDKLVPFARNSRTHSPDQVQQIVASIKEFGFTNPVLIDGKNEIIAGHGRVMAANESGLKQVPCIMLDHLTDVQKRAYVIADNKLAENAGWDDVMLKAELQDIQAIEFDLSLTGFDADELGDLFSEFDDVKINKVDDRISQAASGALMIECAQRDIVDISNEIGGILSKYNAKLKVVDSE